MFTVSLNRLLRRGRRGEEERRGEERRGEERLLDNDNDNIPLTQDLMKVAKSDKEGESMLRQGDKTALTDSGERLHGNWIAEAPHIQVLSIQSTASHSSEHNTLRFGRGPLK
ncbi:unnamed protein product [Pleuronectes platessa]|uniref:Uncharacterized protein n=1 Tax=Pleuronectes platessa TaxID=8262 RepID=A0A9N7VN77_PLEPL|nr:unnamed protein product [Pleuronectes platessa]